ncbi:Mitochondrial matrix cochaperone [Thelotrema lepadinum]|nr:Mitochondrial matrix cochaperone [Thelotrema lepadinum]
MLQRSLRFVSPLSREQLRSSPRASTFAARASARIQQPSTFIHTSSRLYAAVEEAKAEGKASSDIPPTAEPSSQTPVEENPLQEKLESQGREIIDLKDKYLRSVADFRNLQERTKRDISTARDFAITGFAKDLVDSVDNLDRALSTVPAEALVTSDSSDAPQPNKDLVSLHGGLKMTEGILMQTLAKHGLERYDPAEKGDKFDPNLHEANFMAPSKDKEDGTVLTTIQKGFILNGRVIRAAKVGVVKNS